MSRIEQRNSQFVRIPSRLAFAFGMAVTSLLSLTADANAGVMLSGDMASQGTAVAPGSTSRLASDPLDDPVPQVEPFAGLSGSLGGGATSGVGLGGVFSSPALLLQPSVLPGLDASSRLCEERAAVPPTSPLFDHLDPPRFEA